jgi:hypothetical protein
MLERECGFNWQNTSDPSIEDVVQQQDLVLSQVEDLWRYREGELLTFLLKLSPEQENIVNRALSV